MYSIYNKYAGGPAEYNKDAAAGSQALECMKKILPPS
jgi:hypothetical protein